MSTAAPPHTRPPVTARPYVVGLAVSVAFTGAVRWWLVQTRGDHFATAAPLTQWMLGLSVLLQVLLTVAFGAAVATALPALRSHRLPSRHRQRLLGVLATATLVLTFGGVLLSIYRRQEASYELLVETLLLYLAINLVFLFWYWYADHPLRDGVQLPDHTLDYGQGICFPEEELAASGREAMWVPGFTDYAYFTLLSSNCLGSPEGHVLVGRTLKLVQIVHTMLMIFVFIVFVARAINTLA